MAKVTTSRHLDVPADQIWERIGDFHALQTWHPLVAACESANGGNGRMTTTTDGGQVAEALLDEGPLTYTFRIDRSELPVRDYISTLRVRADGADACVVEWESQFEPVGISEDEAVAMIEGFLQTGLDSL